MSKKIFFAAILAAGAVHVASAETWYGTFGAVGSGAENEVAWITGTGTIRALQAGTWLILR